MCYGLTDEEVYAMLLGMRVELKVVTDQSDLILMQQALNGRYYYLKPTSPLAFNSKAIYRKMNFILGLLYEMNVGKVHR